MSDFLRTRRLLLAALPGIPFVQPNFLDGRAEAGAVFMPTGAVARPAVEKLSDMLSAKDFGAIGDGRTDDTQALMNLLAAMQEQGKPGILGGAGEVTRYVVRTGALAWAASSSESNVAGPTLHTAGRVILSAKAGSPDAPFLHIHNDPGAGGRFVHGGYVGSLEFEDDTADRAPNRHGIQLYGVECMRFGPIFSEKLQGDLIHVEAKGTPRSGDLWHVYGCIFESLVTWNTAGWTLNNASIGQFFNGNEIGLIWNINGAKGLWRGPGSGNNLRFGSVQGNRGWAIDWTPAPADSSVQANRIEALELDGPEFGIRINGVQAFSVGAIRIVHRRGGLPNMDGGQSAWPKTALRLGGREGLATSGGDIGIVHYFRDDITDTTKHQIGVLIDLQDDPTTQQVKVDNLMLWTQRLTDVANGSKFALAKYLVGHNPNAKNIEIAFNGKSLLRNIQSNGLIARIAGGRLTSSYDHDHRLDFSNVQLDEGSNYAVLDREYQVPATGKYNVAAQLMVEGVAGELIRLGIMVNGHVARETYAYAAGGPQTFRVEMLGYPLSRGDRLSIAGYAAGDRPFAGGSAGIADNNIFEVMML